jgi:rhamnogalacturonyl hydrolase YesR
LFQSFGKSANRVAAIFLRVKDQMRLVVEKSFKSLKDYVEKENFEGWDPYDGLNSSYFQGSIFNEFPLMRLAWIQLFKRNPINLRKLCQVKKGANAKGLALFLSGYCKLYQSSPHEDHLQKIRKLVGHILSIQSKGYSGSCWGYNFDWQARAFFQPKGTPTVVATTYVVYSLLDAYDVLKDENLLVVARSACDFVLKDLNRTEDNKGNFCFSYSPLDKTQVFNASLLGSRLLSRVYSYTGEQHLIAEAQRSVSFCVNHQKEDGSWPYGTLPFHQWIDSFHTGFNLECMSEYQKFSRDDQFKDNIQRGFDFYINNFFTHDGKSKYYNSSIYPIDTHSPAQLIVTLHKLEKMSEHRELVERVMSWTIQNMQHPDGYFYYQFKRRMSSKIPYMRWAQAWMFFSFSIYLTTTHDH